MLSFSAGAQKHNFINWNIENGLVQSQVTSITQDRFGYLWIGTEGGISKFDGKQFSNFDVNDGLLSNHVSAIATSPSNEIIIGSEKGISIHDGAKFKNYPISLKEPYLVNQIYSKEQVLYLRINNHLYTFTKGQIRLVLNEKVNRIYPNQNQLLLIVNGDQLCAYSDAKLTVLKELSNDDGLWFYDLVVTTWGDTILSSNKGLYKLQQHNLTSYLPIYFKNIGITKLAIAQDALWIGTSSGAYVVNSKDQVSFYNNQNGLSNNSIRYVIGDREQNIWIGTDADGIFKKSHKNGILKYDNSNIPINACIFGICKTQNNVVYFGGTSGQLLALQNNGKLKIVAGQDPKTLHKIHCLTSMDNDVIIGTSTSGIWTYKSNLGLQKKIGAEECKSVNHILYDDTLIYICSSNGLLVCDKQFKIQRKLLSEITVNAIKKINDKFYIATSSGLFCLAENKKIFKVDIPALTQSNVLSISSYKQQIWLATAEKGIYVIDSKHALIRNINQQSGLSSNFVYCIATDNRYLWAGTGRGLNRIDQNDYHALQISSYGKEEGVNSLECNLNALYPTNNEVWFGTAKELYHLFASDHQAELSRPNIEIQSIQLFSKIIYNNSNYRNDSLLKNKLIFDANQNNLSITLSNVNFDDYSKIKYKYLLKGADKNYIISDNNIVQYPNLNYGNYSFIAQTINTETGAESVPIEFNFEIKKSFFQTNFFFALLAIIALLVIFAINRYRNQQKEAKAKLIERIRTEEFNKIRQQTAEDFHDEIGNKLTRITVLSDLLIQKGKDAIAPDQFHIIEQIKENTNALYNGSREIIWSLNAENDYLNNFIEHISMIGRDFFDDTAVTFDVSIEGNDFNNPKLKINAARALLMCIKEIYTNTLKHAQAKTLQLRFNCSSNDLYFSSADNGIGFDRNSSTAGNGIKNIENRIKRIGGTIHISKVNNASDHAGTQINIILKNCFIN